jgi:adenylate cyclase
MSAERGTTNGSATPIAPVRYRLRGMLGKGGMGEVWLAEDTMLERAVAIKFLPERLADDPEARERFLREARSAAALDHPFICKIFEVAAAGGRPCIVMEYVRGETLERRLRAGALALPHALEIAEEIADALEAAHKRRIVHRDLKPSNIIVTEEGHVKVMDFGLAKRLTDPSERDEAATMQVFATQPGQIFGTPAYMSPEQLTGHPLDGRSDIFSFGVLFYEMLAGIHPFVRANSGATMAAILQDEPPPLDGRSASGRLSPIVARMLGKRPSERYQTPSDLRLDLRAALVGLGRAPLEAPLEITEPAAVARGTFVGRGAEKIAALQAVNDTLAGKGRLLLFAGEPGVGKTRLAEEILAAARARGCLTLVGHCYEAERDTPFLPFAEILEQALRYAPASVVRDAAQDVAAELASIVPEYGRLFPDQPAAVGLSPEQQRRHLLSSVRLLLERCSRAAPLAILLDDLQWADESTLSLLQHVAVRLPEMPLLVLGTYRDDELSVDHPLARAREPLMRQRLARSLTLRPLGEAEVAAMLAALGGAPPPGGLVHAIYAETEGNPFFVEEVFRHLVEEGALIDANGHWLGNLRVDALDVPESVRLVIGRRLQRLSSETRRVLTVAAIVGRHFDIEVLETVAEVDGDGLLGALEEGERAHLLAAPFSRRATRWRFAHQLVHQTLERDMSLLRRRRLHARIADVIEHRYRDVLDKHSAELAHHLYRAGPMADPAKAARFLTQAGAAAAALYANEEAVRHYERAIETLVECKERDAERLLLVERTGDLLGLMAERQSALDRYDEVRRTYEAWGDPPGQARACRKIGELLWAAGERQRAQDAFERGLALLQDHPDHLERAYLCQELGRAAFRTGENGRAVAWAEQALATAERVAGRAGPSRGASSGETAAVVAHAHNTIGVALARLGRIEEARERIERSVAAAMEHGLLQVACRGYANLGVLYSTVDPTRAIETSRTGLELAKKIGAVGFQPHIYANLASAYCALTDRCEDEGVTAAEAAVELDRRLEQFDHLAVPLIVLGHIRQCHGELGRALACYREALELGEKMGEPQLLFPCYDGLATVYLDRGDTAQAEAYLRKAQETCERAGLDPDQLVVLPFLC